MAQGLKDNEAFRVMTYNIRYAGSEETDGVNAWSKRKNLVASMIRFHHADIVGLQEALLLQLDDLTKLLPAYSWVGVGRDDGKIRGSSPLFCFVMIGLKFLNNQPSGFRPLRTFPRGMGCSISAERFLGLK